MSIEGILRVSVPLSTVSTVNSSHCAGIAACHSTSTLQPRRQRRETHSRDEQRLMASGRREGVAGRASLTMHHCLPLKLLPQTT